MEFRWLGAIMIIAGCGGYGFSLAARYRQQERTLSELINALERMECELQYRMTPLPELCRMAAQDTSGILRKIFASLARELEERIMPDATSCMHSATARYSISSKALRLILVELGQSLGRFDLSGQLKGLASVRRKCLMELDNLGKNRSERLRCYQTLGLCAGAALAILFL